MTSRCASRRRKPFSALALTSFVVCACSAVLAANMQAAPPNNSVSADAASIASGKKLFSSNCASCHGETAEGDGKAGNQLNPKPANLVDETWIHGSSDGEIFIVIRDGVKNTGMKAFGSRMTAHQMWDVLNYVRSIGPERPSPLTPSNLTR